MTATAWTSSSLMATWVCPHHHLGLPVNSVHRTLHNLSAHKQPATAWGLHDVCRACSLRGTTDHATRMLPQGISLFVRCADLACFLYLLDARAAKASDVLRSMHSRPENACLRMGPALSRRFRKPWVVAGPKAPTPSGRPGVEQAPTSRSRHICFGRAPHHRLGEVHECVCHMAASPLHD